MKRFSWLSVILWGGLFAGAAPAEELQLRGIPYKPDPPPAIDGRLEEWENVPGAFHPRSQSTGGARSGGMAASPRISAPRSGWRGARNICTWPPT